MNDPQSVAQALNYIVDVLDIVVNMSLQPDKYDEVAAETVRLGQIVSRANLILSFIEAQKPVKIEKAN